MLVAKHGVVIGGAITTPRRKRDDIQGREMLTSCTVRAEISGSWNACIRPIIAAFWKGFRAKQISQDPLGRFTVNKCFSEPNPTC
jgi:hypothetical protein